VLAEVAPLLEVAAVELLFSGGAVGAYAGAPGVPCSH